MAQESAHRVALVEVCQLLRLRTIKRKGRNKHERSKDALPWNDCHQCNLRSVCKLIPPSADGFRDPQLRAADRVSVQILSLYATGTDASGAGVQAERLYHGRETNRHFARQGK